MERTEHQCLQLFKELYFADRETAVDEVLTRHPEIFSNPNNWRPLGGNDKYFAVIEAQQASPIAALIEKLTNSIDAILMRRCLEEGIDPPAPHAPRSMQDAVNRFFPDHKLWEYAKASQRREQAERIQVVAGGTKRDTSLIIYDDGEGQRPEDFEDTFLSLLRGNKIKIHFVQGKYNMGGSGAIVFCGRKRYQLIGSKRCDGTGKFGFTLVREHPFTRTDGDQRGTLYEYFVMNRAIPSFPCEQMDLGLHKRPFTTGTIIKLYSYQLPSGISDISRDLNQSINEYLFEPALPIYIIESESRYPDNRQRERHLYGLKRRLEQEDSAYVEDSFSEEAEFSDIGRVKATCYVFRTRIKDKNAKETREAISREFFKNNMSVLFSINGQVHGHYTSEFITRTLKMNLLKHYLLIHVDCTNLEPKFRKELTMASRDRLKGGVESRRLREELGKMLRASKLAEINKRRREVLDLDSSQTDELVRSFAANLPLDSEMTRLLDQVVNLHRPDPRAKKDGGKSSKKRKQTKPEHEGFDPKRFPSFFKMQIKHDGEVPAVSIPVGGERTVRFSTDVENMYFDRVDEPGDLQIALLNHKENETSGGTAAGKGKDVSAVMDVRKSSPDNGTIKLHLCPTTAVSVGDSLKVKATLTSPTGDFEQAFWVKIRDPQKPQKKRPKQEEDAKDLGLPEYLLLSRQPTQEGWLSWDHAEEMGVDVSHDTVMHPVADGDKLTKILINMDSSVWMNFRTSLGTSPTQEQLEIAQRRYIASVYFHTLFLYMIMKTRGYRVQRDRGGEEAEELGVEDYLKEVFEGYYADFLIRFNMTALVEALAD